MFEDLGMDLTLSGQSQLWEPLTDMLFEKKEGIWTKNSASKLMPLPTVTLKVGEAEAIYTLRGTIDMMYLDQTMSMNLSFVDKDDFVPKGWH